MRERKNIKRNIIQLVIIGVLTLICCGLGVVALTSSKTFEFGLGVRYTPDILVEVQMEVDGQYKTIFNSANPGGVDFNAAFIDSAKNDTLFLKSELTTVGTSINLKIINKDSNSFLRCYINDSTTPTYLEPSATSQIINVATNGDTQILGLVLVGLKFEATEAVTITYMSDGAVYETQLLEVNTLPQLISDPTKVNETFMGWYYDSAFTLPWDSSLVVAKNITLYAKWISGFEITYDLIGCDGVDLREFANIDEKIEFVFVAQDETFSTWKIICNDEVIDAVIDYAPALSTATFELTINEAKHLHVSAAPYWDRTVADSFAYGTGNESDPFIIKNGAQLAYLAAYTALGGRITYGKYFKLGCDIYLNEGNVIDSNGNLVQGKSFNEWTPIGDYRVVSGMLDSSYIFSGCLDGDGYVISGIYINKDSTSYHGLFAALRGTVKNLGIINGYIKGSGCVGGISGESCYDLQIYSCFSSVTVVGNNYCGGIIGSLDYGDDVYNCYNLGLVSGSSYVGGIVGNINEGGTVKNCYNLGTVSSTSDYVGGIAGKMDVGDSDIFNCYNAGNITTTSICKGGICSDISGSTNCYYLQGTITDSSATVTTSANLKSVDWLVANLSWSATAWKNDSKNINNGYPILSWQ